MFSRAHWPILRDLVVKQFRVRYAGSAFGMLWAVINPLLLAAIIAFVFIRIMQVTFKDFHLFILAGLLPWHFFSAALQESCTCMRESAPVLRSHSFPLMLVPMATVAVHTALLCIGFLVVLPFFVAVRPEVLLLLPALCFVIILHGLFTAGLSLVLSVCCVRFRDVGYMLNMFLLLWLWLTPVFFAPEMIPAGYRLLFTLNPMSWYVISYRMVLIDGALPNLPLLGTIVILSVSSAFAGAVVFRALENQVVKRL